MREVFILVAAFAAFASAIAAYLLVFHGEVPLKDVLSNAFAAVAGLYAGRWIERRLNQAGAAA
ncbi:hypothetical protein GCM10011371_06440 [Novosphingobium marinum]|uniref:Putative membrane protein YfcA n=1 Tax=Novosphingobium marinum TaxID=1514948 RepID=A0A7Y9XTS4_9SPHN|nr:hypothetical protein [Novosphingobium marinum]NYH94332.1 putative membrane protein YfcA [Novosphingobium marinum]GGC21502.1 hypothetical protein GCM10011371_06440 [Novosphingobium marinum]